MVEEDLAKVSEEEEKRKSGNEDRVKPPQTKAHEEEEVSSSEDDFSDYTDSDYDELDERVDAGKQEEEEEENFAEEFKKKLEKRTQEEKAAEEELWNFPPDKEHWTEEDLGEHWEDYWGDTRAAGWDPNFVSERSWEKYEKLWEEGKPGPPGTPYYVPYRKFYPPIPDNHFDIQTPEDVVEELERTEEFLRWYSYLFKDGSSYEGTVWDDLAHGKGIYTTALDLIKYEGDWFQNMMQGHGVVEADIPVDEPLPDTEEAAMAKAEGQLLRSDYMDPFDREWLKMNAEEQFQEHGRVFTSWEEKEGWIEKYEELPEKGHYKYSGQWKHSRFHGCGVYEINGRTIWGKFYFGELLPDPDECTIDFSALHAGLAEVAAAKARMFANKPDGMVRQVKGPFTDPSHPYMYEEEDLWMAPGFINAYYEVPEDWKIYVEELDKEREMWLNSFYKAPFTVPMPPELEYLWSQEDEYVLLGNTPSVMADLNPENVERASEDLQGDVLLHVPTGRIINWYTDKEGQLRFFYQPITENGEVIPEAIIPLPTGFDEALKEEEDASEEKNIKKNFFQKLKEAWIRTSEDYQKDRQTRIEQLKTKWKQEDQAAEYRGKLKKAERNLAFQIEVEKRRAKRMNKGSREEEPAGADEPLQGQPEQVEEAESLDAVAAGSKEEEENKEGEENDAQANQEDIKDGNEDDKKPKSFGKVAMLDIEDERARSRDVKHEPLEQGFTFPTTFASLTLESSKMNVGEILKTKMGVVLADLFCWKGQSCIQRMSSHSSSSCFRQKHSSNLYLRSCISEDLRMRTSRSSQKLVCTPLHGARCSRARQLSMPKMCGGSRILGKSRRQQHHFKVDSFWMRPKYEFLSITLPCRPFSDSY